MRSSLFTCCLLFLLVLNVFSQDQAGIQWGHYVIRPEAEVTGAYDNRVISLPGDDALGDFYTDVEAGVRLNNLPAKYRISGLARYGYRFYSEYAELDDDFYRANATVGSREDPFRWSLGADLTKSLNYNTSYDPSSGQLPDSILTNAPNRRIRAHAGIGYEKKFSEKMSILPEYRLQHYHQEFETEESAEWQIHTAMLQLRRKQSEKTVFTVAGDYRLQANRDEDGNIASVMAGIEFQATEMTSLLAELGYAVADYEFSGTDDGWISRLRAQWQATEKIGLYAFGGNDFQPGYNGGAARRVYRLGYGAKWKLVEKLSILGSVLHDYQEPIGSNSSANDELDNVKHFVNASARYRLTNRFSLALGFRYVRDEKTPDLQVASLRVKYVY
jgi:hypothetical protein